jgi:hypothetical protein
MEEKKDRKMKGNKERNLEKGKKDTVNGLEER